MNLKKLRSRKAPAANGQGPQTKAKTQTKGKGKALVPAQGAEAAASGKEAPLANKAQVKEQKKWKQPEILDQFAKVEDPDFAPAIHDTIWAALTAYLIWGQNVEITGNFWIDPQDTTIKYISLAGGSKGSGGGVTLEADDAAVRYLRDQKMGYTPNGQWHTHPGFRAYWSFTDLEDHAAHLKLATAWGGAGEFYFAVISDYAILLRRYRWSEEGKSYSQAHVALSNGTLLDGALDRSPYSHSYGAYGGYGSYGGYGGAKGKDAKDGGQYRLWGGRGDDRIEDDDLEWLDNLDMDRIYLPGEDQDDGDEGRFETSDDILLLMAGDRYWFTKLTPNEHARAKRMLRYRYPNIEDLCHHNNAYADLVEAANDVLYYLDISAGEQVLRHPALWPQYSREG